MSPATIQRVDAPAGRILETVRKYWGYESLRPLQAEAIQAGLDQRDSLVVLPTGGGKSLCYQVPAILAERTDIVVSPLISLMKDQVDALKLCGYPAAAIHSGLAEAERRQIEHDIDAGKYRLLFLSPERLLTSWSLRVIERLKISSFAIDEAHCISHWGHDFRPEYRQLATLKDRIPRASIHAYTATATPRVREDISAQLKLDDPNVLVGRFDRPNLIYRIVPRVDGKVQVLEVIQRHAGEAVIVYCISRKDTEYMAEFLKANGVNAAAYHAGIEKHKRTEVQDAFAAERLDVVVATVAFGMGIDRSNVRCVIHAAMPKSVEHYQQETGRAGRDGLEAECILFYSAADSIKWESLFTFSAQKANEPEEVVAAQLELLRHIARLANTMNCRHRALSEYFGQKYEPADCAACDVCLDELETMPDSTVAAQKILSCVARVQERFGIKHVVDVLAGGDTEMIRKWEHDKLSTFGLMSDTPRKAIQNLAYQLVDQELLERTEGDKPLLRLNDASRAVLRGQRNVTLLKPKSAGIEKTKRESESWEGVDRGLFEHLRTLRREIAGERSVPAFVIFADSVLRELAAVRPSKTQTLKSIRGIGQKKLADLGERFLNAIVDYCRENNLDTENEPQPVVVIPPKSSSPNPAKETAYRMFDQGKSIDDVAANIQRARSTTTGYLSSFISERKPASISAWVDEKTYRRVTEAAATVDDMRLKPIRELLNEEVSYEIIRIVLQHLQSTAE